MLSLALIKNSTNTDVIKENKTFFMFYKQQKVTCCCLRIAKGAILQKKRWLAENKHAPKEQQNS